MGRDGAASHQAAAADGHDQNVQIRHILKQFQGHRALTGDHVRVVEGGYEQFAGFLGMGQGGIPRGVEIDAFQNDLCAQVLGPPDLGEGGAFRHVDGRRDVQSPGVIGHALGVVTGRGGDDAARTFVIRQAAQLDPGATDLERARDLQILQLQINIGAGRPRQPAHRQGRGANDLTLQLVGGIADGIYRHGHGTGSVAATEAAVLHACLVFWQNFQNVARP